MVMVATLKGIKGCCFMPCPICKEDILIEIDKWSKCKKARNPKHMKSKRVFTLKKDLRTREGFSQILEARVPNYQRKTLEELEV